MVRTTRRRVLAGVTMAALPGCLNEADKKQTTNAESTPSETPAPTAEATPTSTPTSTETPEEDVPALPDEMVTVLDPVPKAVEGTRLSRLWIAVPSPDTDEILDQIPMGKVVYRLGIGLDNVDRIAAASYDDDQGRRTITVISGSFDGTNLNLPEDVPDDAVYVDDGILMLARGPSNDRWSTGLSAAEVAIDDDFELSTDTRMALVQTPDATTLRVFPSITSNSSPAIPDIDAQDLQSIAVGRTRIDPATIQYTVVGVFSDESAYDRSQFKTVIGDAGYADQADVAIERDGRVATGSFTLPFPSEELRDRSPDVWLETSYDIETGTAQLRSIRDEPINTDQLTVYVNGEAVPDAWDGKALGPADSISVEVEPLSAIVIEWTDPENPAYQTVVSHKLISDGVTFEENYDRESETLTLTYTGPEPITQTDWIEIEHRSSSAGDDGQREAESLATFRETLSPGSELAIEEVTPSDRVTLSASHSVDRSADTESLATILYSFHA